MITFETNYLDQHKISTLMSKVYYQNKYNCTTYIEWFFKKSTIISIGAINENHECVGAYIIEVVPLPNGNILQNGEIFVDPDFQQQGIAQQLYDKMIDIGIKKHNIFYHQISLLRPFTLKDFFTRLGYQSSQRFTLIEKNF